MKTKLDRHAPARISGPAGCPSGAKALASLVFVAARLNRLRKKGEQEANCPKSIPQGLKPGIDSNALAARLKSCPVTKPGLSGVFPRHVKSCPDKKQRCKFNKTK